MKISELIEHLQKLDENTEVWVDTPVGLLPMDGLYFADDTAIITYADMVEDIIYN